MNVNLKRILIGIIGNIVLFFICFEVSFATIDQQTGIESPIGEIIDFIPLLAAAITAIYIIVKWNKQKGSN